MNRSILTIALVGLYVTDCGADDTESKVSQEH
ncbi:MAG: hypothetical protein ACJAVI_002564 [Candidatus Azotimanducaceae bacterium]|jgi:hypothetical protein